MGGGAEAEEREPQGNRSVAGGAVQKAPGVGSGAGRGRTRALVGRCRGWRAELTAMVTAFVVRAGKAMMLSAVVSGPHAGCANGSA